MKPAVVGVQQAKHLQFQQNPKITSQMVIREYELDNW